MRAWWFRNGSATTVDRIIDFFHAFRPLEILKGLVLTGRYFLAPRDRVRD